MSSTSNTSSYSSLSMALNKGYLDSQNPRCFCGQTVVLMTAYKEENPGRRFYACHYFTLNDEINSWKLKHETLKLEMDSFKRKGSGTWVQILKNSQQTDECVTAKCFHVLFKM
ncbi:hypothetical protein ACFE04_011225 [Oxalis oulophora]